MMTFNSIQRVFTAIVMSMLAIGLTGCEESIEVRYGKNSSDSVNGTGILREMFNKAGFTTRTRYSLRPELNRNSDVLIWFPNDLDPPTQKQIQWFDNWLTSKSGRTLIYVGRDFDCEPLYWAEVQKRGLSANPAKVAGHLQVSTSRVAREISTMTLPMNSSWFSKTTLATQGLVGKLGGPWSASVNSAQHEIHANTTLAGSTWSTGKPLLTVQTGPKNKPTTEDFVFEETVTATTNWNAGGWNNNTSNNQSQRIIINNGSFLLNYALVNKEHRVIADHLIKHLAGATNVTFIESNQGGPPVHDTDNYSEHPNAWQLFKIQPLGTILFHLALIGIVFCFVRWPIFGRTRQEPSLSSFDVALHLKALASLLRISKDTGEAQRRVAQYHAMQRELSKRGIVKSNTQ